VLTGRALFDSGKPVPPVVLYTYQLSGTITCQADGMLRIRLDPPDIPRCAVALQGLCETLNQLGPRFPGTTIPVFYEVAMHHLGNAA